MILDQVSLGDICKEIYRYPTYYGIEYLDSGVPEVRGELINEDGTIDLNRKKWRFISENTASKFPRTNLEEGDLIMSVRGTIGKIGIVPRELYGGNITANLIRISPNRQKVYERYLWMYMRSPEFLSSVDNESSSTTIKTIKAPNLKALKIPLPPIKDQKQIADILDLAEALRAKRRVALSQLDELAQDIFIEMFGDPVSNPKKWPRYTLEEITEKITDGEHLNPQFSQSGMPIIMAGNVLEDLVDIGNSKMVESSLGEKFRQKCNPEIDDLLVVSRGATIGRLCVVNINQLFCLMGSVILIKPLKGIVDSRFLSTFLKHPVTRSALYNTSGSSAQQAIYLKDLKRLLCICPSLSLQQEFSRRVAAIENLKKKHKASLKELDELFTSLQYRAFRGEL